MVADSGGKRFAGKSVIVIGGARGIGAATARAFAAAGAAVTIGDVLSAEGEGTAAEIASAGGTALFRRCDVAEADDVAALVQLAADSHGGVDCLFNNVGITRYGRVHELADEDWQATLAANLTGMFLACKHAIPHMLERGGGAIVNTASALAHASQPLTSAYAASKGGVLALTRTIAVDYAGDGIRCNSISPGTVDTPIVRLAAEQIDADRVEELIASWGQLHPLGRVGTADEIAATVLFLASDEASFVTGSDFAVDGGLRASLIKE